MLRLLVSTVAAAAALAAVPSMPAQATVVAGAGPATVYDATVAPLPPNLPSQAFQAQQTAEFGNEVTLAGSSRQLQDATVTFSTWAPRSQWPGYGTADGWTWPVTLNVYSVDTSGSAPAVGTLLGSTTQDVAVPWRPEPSPTCADGRWSPSGSTACYGGKAFNATFDLSSVGAVPDHVIVTVAYNTETWGADPVGSDGPYDSLNVALRDTDANGPVPVGTDTDAGDVFWNTSTASNYADGGAGGTGTLRRDTNWAPYTPAIALTATGGGCEFSESGSTLTLLGDCTTDQTIAIPNGSTLDGAGHTITAVDPAGGHFTGAVLTNAGAGTDVGIRNVTITASGLANVCDGGAERLRGILLDGVGGTIDDVTVTGVRQGLSGCQEGNAIEARNFAVDGSSPATPAVAVTVSNSTVADYQKNGITFNGGVNGTATGNTVTGDGPVGYIAQNGIQVGFGASGTVTGNEVHGNWYTGSDEACGLLLYQAGGVKQSKNDLSGNEKSLCNYGRGGGRPAS